MFYFTCNHGLISTELIKLRLGLGLTLLRRLFLHVPYFYLFRQNRQISAARYLIITCRVTDAVRTCLQVASMLKIRVTAHRGRLTDRRVMSGSADWSDVGWRWRLPLSVRACYYTGISSNRDRSVRPSVGWKLFGTSSSVAAPSIKFRGDSGFQ